MKHLQLSSRCFGCTQPNQTSKNLVKFGRHGGRAAATTRWLISHHFSEADLWAVSSLHASVIQQVCLNFHSPICPVVLEMPLCPKLVRTTGILRHQALVYAFKQAGGFLAMGCTWMQRDPGLGEVWLSIAICDKKNCKLEVKHGETRSFFRSQFPAGVCLAARFSHPDHFLMKP
jgi:hypothetical protein